MVRYLGLPALLVVAFIVALLYTQDLSSNGPTSSSGQQVITQAQGAVAAANFGQAAEAMQAYFDQSGTYAGATLPPGSEVSLVSAGATSYCLQAGNEHENGPSGQPQPGPC